MFPGHIHLHLLQNKRPLPPFEMRAVFGAHSAPLAGLWHTLGTGLISRAPPGSGSITSRFMEVT